MSAEGQAFVENYSPYSGATYLVHLRMGMLANETHQYRLFAGDRKFADLCRCSVKTLQRARRQMIRDGYLEVIRTATGRHVAEYRFLFPSIGGQPDYLSSLIGGQRKPNRWTSEAASPIYGIEGKEADDDSDSEPVDVKRKVAAIKETLKGPR